MALGLGSPRHTPEVLVSGLPLLATGFWSVVFGLYAYLLPFVLLAAWVALALWDLGRRDDLSRTSTIVWIAVVLIVPFVGVVVYLAGRARLPGWFRAAVVGGGTAAYLVVVAIGGRGRRGRVTRCPDLCGPGCHSRP